MYICVCLCVYIHTDTHIYEFSRLFNQVLKAWFPSITQSISSEEAPHTQF